MSSGAYLFIGLALGGGLGLLIGWLLGSRKQTAALATALANQAAAEKILGEQKQLQDQTLRDARVAQEKALADLREAFRALSAEALSKAQPEFLVLAKQSFETLQAKATGDLAQKEQAIKGLVEPLAQQLQAYQSRLQQSETAQSSTLGEVKKQLELLSQQSSSLANETQQFRMVLTNSQARGRWGEETLRRVVEAAGMSAHCDFDVQVKEGDSQPDLIVQLPGERFIIVDAKVPELEFLAVLDTADTAKRADFLAAHAKKLRETIKALAERDYPGQFKNALDYVVLFMPAESLFSAALEGDHELIVWAANKKILLATPASLIALLRSVSVSWQQHAQTENAQEIAVAAQEFYKRVVVLIDHLKDIRSGLKKSNDAFDAAVGSYNHSVRPQGEKLRELGNITQGDELADVQPLDSTLRLPPG